MKQAGSLAVVLTLVVWLLWNLWNLFRIAADLRKGMWRRPMWWTRLCSVSLFAGLASWFWGIFSGGLDVRETCQFVHRERYDETYVNSHTEEFQRLFPLHNKCNAHYDLVPAWVNPTIVICAVVSVIAAAALVRFGIAHLSSRIRKSRVRKENQAVGDGSSA